MILQMDNHLERYERVQDGEFETYLSEPRQVYSRADFLHNKRIYLMREIERIEKHLANNECDEYVNPRAWRERIEDCRTQLVTVEAQLKELEVAN